MDLLRRRQQQGQGQVPRQGQGWPREHVNVPMHQVEWHWQHSVPLTYPEATLPHDWHLDPERIPVPAVSWSARVLAEQVRRRRVLLTPDQRRDLAYATDSPNWASWFAFEHEEARRHGAHEFNRIVPLPPHVVRDEDHRESEEDERRRTAATEQEEATYEAVMAHAMALSAAGDFVLPPVTPPSPVKDEAKPEPSPSNATPGRK
ncbi:hypothetical protein D1007_37453 [Hordeum vulgare]|nr:hypothetical protein D1007_37453 [Hordeum vulgare]